MAARALGKRLFVIARMAEADRDYLAFHRPLRASIISRHAGVSCGVSMGPFTGGLANALERPEMKGKAL
jgi:hypothetical protein